MEFTRRRPEINCRLKRPFAFYEPVKILKARLADIFSIMHNGPIRIKIIQLESIEYEAYNHGHKYYQPNSKRTVITNNICIDCTNTSNICYQY